MKFSFSLFSLIIVTLVLSCSQGYSSKVANWERYYNSSTNAPVTLAEMMREVGLQVDLIPPGTAGRKQYRPMNPRYITIHSTQNDTGNAYAHAKALKNGALKARKRPGGNRIGYLTWHFTTQDDTVIQHLPCHEQGEHADFDGPGNNYSIGIEMCEHRGNNLALTIDRTAKMAACLMKINNIPLNHVVPHYHWPRHGTSPLHKNCPHFLMESRGREDSRAYPGRTWNWFLQRVKLHFDRIQGDTIVHLG
jgi:N-acetylmuramoyl-L-alanine amidase